jgi:uncharacterized protein
MQTGFGLNKHEALPRYCRECVVRFACHGGCARSRCTASPTDEDTPRGEPDLNYLCAGYKMFFTHIDQPMRLMASLLRQGQPLANIVRWYTRYDARMSQAYADANPGDPCPCGSGRKVK